MRPLEYDRYDRYIFIFIVTIFLEIILIDHMNESLANIIPGAFLLPSLSSVQIQNIDIKSIGDK